MKTYEVDVGGKTYEVDAPDPDTAYRLASEHAASAKARAAEAAKTAEAERRAGLRERVAGMSGPAAVMANLGAGVQNLGMGLRQVGSKVGLADPVTDAEIDRKRADDDVLAEGTRGGKLLQIGGEVLPTLAVPGGAFVKGAQLAGRAGSVLTKALQGQRASMNAGQILRAPTTIGRATVDGALAGGTIAAASPTRSDESRATNMALGTAGGALGPAAVGALREGYKVLTKTGRQQLAGRRLTEGLGNDAAGVAAQIDLYAPPSTTANIPLTVAEMTGNTRAAGLERRSARDFPDQWADFARGQNESIYDAVDAATRRRANAPALEMARDALTTPGRDISFQLANRYPDMSQPLMTQADDLMARSAPRSPQRGLAKLMEETIAENPDAAKLYETRKLLASKLSGPAVPGDDTAAIVKGSRRETAQMIEAIDERLNDVTDGAWGSYLKLYRDMSKPLNNSRALGNIFDDINDPTRALMGDRPQVTRTVLTRAMEKYGASPRYGNRLDAKASRELGDISDLLRSKEEVQRTMRTAGTSGGGSNTAMDTVGAAARDAALDATVNAAAGPLGGLLTRAARAGLDVQGQRELSALMMNPQAAAAAIRAQLAAQQPLNAAQTFFLTQVFRAPIAGAIALQPQGSAQ